MKTASLFAAALLLWHPDAVAGDPAALALSCWNCHGPDGESPGEIPSIAGMSAEAIADSLRGFRSDANQGTIMNRIARGYSDAEIDALSDFLAAVDQGQQP
jgi:cytochrome c553